MAKEAMWPVAFLIALMMCLASGLLVAKVELGAIVAVFALISSLAGTVAGLFAVHKIGKVERDVARVEHNTNGNASEDKDLIRGLVEYLKNSMPVQPPTVAVVPVEPKEE